MADDKDGTGTSSGALPQREIPLREIECQHCGKSFTVHEPLMTKQNTRAHSLVLVMPSWDIAERICPYCGTPHRAVFAHVDLAWISENPEDNKPKQVHMPTPEELAQLTKQQVLKP